MDSPCRASRRVAALFARRHPESNRWLRGRPPVNPLPTVCQITTFTLSESHAEGRPARLRACPGRSFASGSLVPPQPEDKPGS